MPEVRIQSWTNFYNENIYLLLTVEKTKIIKKEAGNGPIKSWKQHLAFAISHETSSCAPKSSENTFLALVGHRSRLMGSAPSSPTIQV